jgi:uncharacterized protein YutD
MLHRKCDVRIRDLYISHYCTFSCIFFCNAREGVRDNDL